MDVTYVTHARAARSGMALKGAELLFYPTAIGSEPGATDLDEIANYRAQWGLFRGRRPDLLCL